MAAVLTDDGALAELRDHYPPDAMRAGIEGSVVLAVTLDTQGSATDILILSEEPLDQGFGAAASTFAHRIKYSNPTGAPAQITFKVRFALHGPPHPSGDSAGDAGQTR
jgi:TonB family protein